MTTKVLGKHLRSTEYNNIMQKNDDCQIKEYWSIMASPLYVLQFLKICRDHCQELLEKELEEEMEGRLRVYRKLLQRAQILRTELAEVCNPSCCAWMYFSTQLENMNFVWSKLVAGYAKQTGKWLSSKFRFTWTMTYSSQFMWVWLSVCAPNVYAS